MFISNVIRVALSQRLMTLLVALSLIVAGFLSFKQLPIDAFPEISSPQVQVIIKAHGLSPIEVEQRITRLVEIEMQGVPDKTVLRSLTKYALSIVTIDFKEGTDIYWARQQVTERLNQIWGDLPQSVEGGLAPISTPLGEAYMFMVEGKGYTNRQLRSILDYEIRPRLLTVEGVAEINVLGGEVRSFHVVPDPKKLLAMDITLEEVAEALDKNNRNSGGDRIVRNNEVLLVRTIGQIKTIDDIKLITIKSRDGTPIHIKDVAEVSIGALTRHGGVTKSGKGEFVQGLVLQRMGANSSKTVEGVKAKIKEIEKVLPTGVKIVPFYDRSDLVNSAIGTVRNALIAAVILVIIVLFVFLGNLRSAITVVAILPLGVSATFILMYCFDITANLMSLGGLAIAIGMLVDPAVVIVENIQTHLAQGLKGRGKLHIIYRATLEVAAPVITGTLIVVIVFLPIFSLSGLEGKLFKPLAVTISLALVSSLILSLTVIPVLSNLIMKGVKQKEGEFFKKTKSFYKRIVDYALRKRKVVVCCALVALTISGWLYTRIGAEFMPRLDEGDIVVIVEKLPSISLKRSLEIDGEIQKALMKLPEIYGVASRMGSDELRLDPMGLYQTDNFLLTIPRSEWTVGSPEELEEKVREILETFPGIVYGFTQPIDMRVSEMLTGVRAAVAIKLSGKYLTVLEEKSIEIEDVVKSIPGSVDVFRTPLTGQMYLNITMQTQAMSRYGVNVDMINNLISMAVGGRVVTEVTEENRQTAVLLRFPEKFRNSSKAIGNILVTTLTGEKVPVRLLADITEVDGPVQITRESTVRHVVIQSNVEGRDIVGYVDEVRAAIAKRVSLPFGYSISYGGQFENQQRASAQLAIVVPIAIALVFLLLFLSFGSIRQSILIIMNIPFALIGSIVALYISGLYVSVPASVGFIALFGIAILNGVVMVSYFNQLRQSGMSTIEAVRLGSGRRLRPVMMTAISTGLGLIPLLLATGPGSEIQKPLAVVVIGGLFTSTLLTLVLLPTLYVWIESYKAKEEII